MPEKMTKEEAIIAMAIKKARQAKSMLHESTQIMPYDHEVEVVKLKRPKAQNVKIKNQTQKKEGYGLAGETLKKKDDSAPNLKERIAEQFKNLSESPSAKSRKDKEDLKSDCREQIKKIEEGMYSLSKSELEQLSNALNDIVKSIL